ncbi:MAG: integrase core domain-containing protein, partial [Streptococcus sp.]|nr:integrase core domain-containing protein [Streptococcus sp.]
TLKDALSTRSVRDELILHSDIGSQYTSKEYNEFLQKHGIQHFYSAKGCPYDNSCIESFHATIKKECIYVETNVGYKDDQSCYSSIFKYIEGFYHSRRRHSKLNYLCPNDFEKQIA